MILWRLFYPRLSWFSLLKKTKLDIDEIRRDLLKIRQQGYDMNDQEREEGGISALAAPVFDFENNVPPATLAIVGSAYRFKEDNRAFFYEKNSYLQPVKCRAC